jgi:hypothetical protein
MTASKLRAMYLYFLCLLGSITANIIIVVMFYAGALIAAPRYPIDFSKFESTHDIIGKTKEGTILVTFEDREKLNSEGVAGKTIATGNYGCHIYLPTDIAIIANPIDIYSARFLHPSDEEIVAHELLHCIKLYWHG